MAPKIEISSNSKTAMSGLSLKLLIDRKLNHVVFAEAGKDVVDFLFSLLQMPIGTVVRLLTTKNTVGCIGNLYESVEDIDDDYIQPDQDKQSLLKPKFLSPISQNVAGLLTHGDTSTEPETKKKYYRCNKSYCASFFTDHYGILCPICLTGSTMVIEIKYADIPKSTTVEKYYKSGGYVKGVATYMMMDDLRVMPMSTISGLTLLNDLGIKDIGSLEEKTVPIGMEQGLDLLKALFESETVLTDVFLVKKKANKRKK